MDKQKLTDREKQALKTLREERQKINREFGRNEYGRGVKYGIDMAIEVIRTGKLIY